MRLTKFITTMAVVGAGLIAFSADTWAADKHYTIALSNGWVNNEWRTQMIEEAQEAAKLWAEKGIEVEVVVQSKNVNVQGQIADVRNFLNQGVHAIIINPNSPTAFNPTFAQAKKQGTIVIATDGEVTSKDAYFVGSDQKQRAETSARWLFEQMGGKGNIVAIHGIAGHPANQARAAGMKAALEDYPGINVLNEASGEWEVGKAQQITQTLLATYPDIDGIWTQEGNSEGVWRAMEAKGLDQKIPATGDARASFLRQWQEKGWKSAIAINPPGVMADAVHVAVLLLEGNLLKEDALKGPNGNALYVPTKLITIDNLAEEVAALEGKPNYTAVSPVHHPDEIKELFFQ